MSQCAGDENHCIKSLEISQDGVSWLPLDTTTYSANIPVPSVTYVVGDVGTSNPITTMDFGIGQLTQADVDRFFKISFVARDFNANWQINRARGTKLSISSDGVVTIVARPILMTGMPVGITVGTDCESQPNTVARDEIVQLTFYLADTRNLPNSQSAIVSSNASCSVEHPNVVNREFRWKISAAHFMPDGISLNSGYYEAVLTAEFISKNWSTSAPELLATGLLATRTDGSANSTELAYTATLEEETGIRVIITGFGFSAPTISLKPKNLKGAAADKVRTTLPAKAKAKRS